MNSFQKFCFALLYFIFPFTTLQATTVKEKKSGVRFTENKNQWDKNILYRAQLDGGVLFLEKNCFTYNFYDKAALRANHYGHTSNSLITSQQSIKAHAFRVSFVNALATVSTQSKQMCEDYNNYFIGKDEAKWASHVGNYKEVIYDNIYPGIKIQLLGKTNSIKYNFLVDAHANPANIELNYDGLDSIYLSDGNLILKTSINQLTEQKPFAYQLINGRQITVPCHFVLKNKTLSFQFPNGYDKNVDLIIDPVLSFACSSGSTADNFGMSATYDDKGNLYSGGTAFDMGYPTTTGAIDISFNGSAGDNDVVITKFDSSGTFLHYSTYLGGSSCEVVSSMIVNPQGELFIYGTTGSSNFPVSTSAYDKSFNGGTNVSFIQNGTNYKNGTDLYVCHFNATGTSLLASTYVGGSQNDGANNSTTALAYNYGDYYRGEMQLDGAGDVYVASTSYSTNFPTTAGCVQSAAGGGMDGVVFKMPPDLSKLTWSTYIGGSADDGCYGVIVDNSLNVFVTGGTASNNFPTTAGAIKTTYGGGQSDGFISKINSSGTTLTASTFIGTNQYDQCFLLQFDKNFDVYTVGQSLGNMPVSAGVYSNANSKQFIWKLNNNLSSTSFTTIFGNGNGQINISPTAFLVDRCDNIYVCGWGGDQTKMTTTRDMPLTPNAYQSTTDGYNFYLFVLTANATSLLYGSYFGGAQSAEHVDGGTSRFDKKGIIYQAVCSGCGGNDDFPVTPGSWPKDGKDVNHSDNCNIGVFKFDFQLVDLKANAVAGPNDTICVNGTINFQNKSTNATDYSWDFGDGSPVSTVNSPNHTYTKAGNYTVTFVAVNNSRCALSDTLKLKIVVLPNPVVDIGKDTTVCNSISLKLDAGNPGSKYTWSTGATTQTIQVTTAGVYWVKVSNGFCEDADTMEVKFTPGPVLDLPREVSICKSDSVVLNAANPGCTYLWSTGATTQTIVVKDAGVYSVVVSNSKCSVTDTTNVIILTLPKFTSDSTLCEGQSLTLKTNVSGANYTYNWSTGATTESIVVTKTGTYWVDIHQGFCYVRDTMTAKFIPLPIVDLPVSLDLCPLDTAKLDSGNPGSTHLWSTKDTTQIIKVTTAGHYVVTVSNGKCSAMDSTDIHIIPPVNTQSTISLCNMESLTLTASVTTNSTFMWSNGSTKSSINTTTPGVYWVRISRGNCISIDTITVIGTVGDGVIYIPNSFSPDNNRINDVFRAEGTDITSYHLSIFDRWGELIYETRNLKEGWDGYYRGVIVQNDVYVWIMDYKTACDEKNTHRRKGIVSVIR